MWFIYFHSIYYFTRLVLHVIHFHMICLHRMHLYYMWFFFKRCDLFTIPRFITRFFIWSFYTIFCLFLSDSFTRFNYCLWFFYTFIFVSVSYKWFISYLWFFYTRLTFNMILFQMTLFKRFLNFFLILSSPSPPYTPSHSFLIILFSCACYFVCFRSARA